MFISKININTQINTNSIQQGNSDNLIKPNSIFGAKGSANIDETQNSGKTEETGKTTEADKAEQLKQAEIEKKLDEAFNKSKEVKFEKNFQNMLDWLEKSKFSAIGKLKTIFKAEADSIKNKLNECFVKLMDFSPDPSKTSLDDIEQIMAELQNLTNRTKNLNSKAEKAVNMDKKLNTFAAKGGDVNKLDLEKVSEDFVKSIELAKDSDVDTKAADSKNSENSSVISSNKTEEPELDDKQKNIDEKLKAFMEFLDSGDPAKVKDKCPEYLKNNDETGENQQINQNENFFNDKKKAKNPFMSNPLS